MKYEIYKLTSPSGKCYIGQTRQGINKRFGQHVTAWKRWIADGRPINGYQRKLFCAFDKYQPENFKIEKLFECDTQEAIDAAEMSFITDLNLINDGYNLTAGGQGLRDLELSEDHKSRIGSSRKEYFETESGQEWKKELRQKFKNDNPSKKGREPWNKGLKCPEHSARLKGRTTITEKGKKSLSEKTKKAWETGIYDNRPSMTDETKKKLSEVNKGKIISKEQKHVVSDKLSKSFEITDPKGNKFVVKNLKKWCEKMGLNRSNIKYPSGSKGYKARRLLD